MVVLFLKKLPKDSISKTKI